MLDQNGAELVHGLEELVPGAVLVVHHLLDVVVPLPVLAEPDELAQVTQVTGSGDRQYHRLLRGGEVLQQFFFA